jgi:AmmeMemoRadiSam system protein B
MPKALVAPHAGYIYSGRVAGAAFAKLRANAQTITRVVLIGPAHYVHLGGIAAPRVDAFETPIGRVLVDTETCSQIGGFEFVTQTGAPHEPEHALEVELPFLQSVLSSFQLVPLVVGDAAPQQVAQLLRQLWGGPETLIVVSSDLSHYHSYETAQRLDISIAEAIEQGDVPRLPRRQSRIPLHALGHAHAQYLRLAEALLSARRRLCQDVQGVDGDDRMGCVRHRPL